MATQTRNSDPIVLWRAIAQAGSIQAYIDQQLKERGFLVQRRETDNMSKSQLSQYKKQLKEEAAERRRLKKEAWAAYKATHLVHLGEGVFWQDDHDFDKHDLPEPEARAQENELPQLDNPKALAEALEVSIPELRGLTYHREAATRVNYTRFTIPKRSGGERAIWAPMPRLKSAQRWILREIVEHLPVHGAAHGFVPGRSIASNAAVHTHSSMVLKMDLKDFFPTVTYRRVKGVFRKAGYREQVATLLALLCTEPPREVVEHDGKTYFVAMGPRCLPQGAPTSPALTNALCMRLDRRLSGLARKLGWRYTRYADDLTFSLPAASDTGKKKAKKKDDKATSNVAALMGGVKTICAAEGFEVHKEKTRVARSGGRQAVTGLIVNGEGTPRVPRALRRQLRAAIHNLSNGKPLKEGETLAQLAGYAAFVHMTNPELGGQMLEDLGRIQQARAGQ
ncbi:MAG: reverse transcriptase family protein [Bradymonadia bacterium]